MRPGTPGPGRLVLVATPIGDLGDLSPRARDVLASADVVCCEDTRRTRALLSAAGIPAATRLRSLHAHNEAARVPGIVAELEAGATVAVVTDAGMPGVSDPGSRLVAAALDAGVGVSVVPGPSAVLAALVVSGLPTERFCAEGFLPRKGAERRRRLAALLAGERTAVLFESPRRLAATLAELAEHAPGRPVAVCRELTKVHEEVWRGSLAAAADEFAARTVKGELRGEIAVVVAGVEPGAGDTGATGAGTGARRGEEGDVEGVLDGDLEAQAAGRLEEGLSTREAADALAGALGVSRRRAYDAVLAARRSGQRR